MSISSVATRGCGIWGSVNLVPTWGYHLSPDYDSRRHILYGTALSRQTLMGTPLSRNTLAGTELSRHILNGATPR